MKPRTLLAPALLVALSTGALASTSSSAELHVSTRYTDKSRLSVEVRGCEGTLFGVQASLDAAFQTGVQFLGVGTLDGRGTGRRAFGMPNADIFPPNTRVYLRAGYVEHGAMHATNTSSLLLNAIPSEHIDFTHAPSCRTIEPGEILRDQWAAVGVRIAVDTHDSTPNPIGIALDSSDPGVETDLATPGSGIGNLDERRNLLVIAGHHDGFDGDGNVDNPIAGEVGGIVVFTFDQPTHLDRITFVDVDAPGSFMRCFDGPTMLAEIPVQAIGDNSAQTIGFPEMAVTKLVVNLRSAAGIAELSYLPCPEELDFDHTMTGIPLGLVEGEVVSGQLRGAYGASIFADTHHATNAGRAIAMRPMGKSSIDDCDRTVLAVAADPTDANNDGILEDSRPEPLGGVIVIDFDFDVTWRSAQVVDVDGGEVSFFKAEDANGNLLGLFPLLIGPDGAIQTVTTGISGVRRIKLNLGGDGALVSLDYCADAHPDSGQGAHP